VNWQDIKPKKCEESSTSIGAGPEISATLGEQLNVSV